MSMTGSGGEENCLEPSSGVFSEGNSRQVSPVPTGAASKCIVSPLLRIFSSKEVVPKILEYEKAVLVMKEHNYAKAVERPEILKLSSLLTESPLLCEDAVQEAQPLDSITDINTLLSTRKDLLLVRESVSRKEDRVVSNHLHQVVGVQIELLREQQEQLHDRDKELSTVRKDKEQLQARMERMERRLAILQKRSKHDLSDSEPFQLHAENNSLIDTTSTPKVRTHRDTLINSEKHSRSRSNSHDRIGRTGRSSRVSSRSGTPGAQGGCESGSSSAKRSVKRKLSDVGLEVISKKRRSRQSDMRTRFEYTGLNLPLPGEEYVPQSPLDRLANHSGGVAVKNDLASSVASSSMSECSGMNGEVNAILVPSWRTCSSKASVEEGEECEDMSEDSLTRRHRKPEDDEKRRKRWDVQRARTLRNHEELLRKYNQKGGGGEKSEKKKERMTTFLPKLSEVETIEIKDTVPVTAFGMPIPVLKPKEFELSWFDLDTRDAKDKARTTRSKAKASNNRQSVGSSADEDFK